MYCQWQEQWSSEWVVNHFSYWLLNLPIIAQNIYTWSRLDFFIKLVSIVRGGEVVSQNTGWGWMHSWSGLYLQGKTYNKRIRNTRKLNTKAKTQAYKTKLTWKLRVKQGTWTERGEENEEHKRYTLEYIGHKVKHSLAKHTNTKSESINKPGNINRTRHENEACKDYSPFDTICFHTLNNSQSMSSRGVLLSSP